MTKLGNASLFHGIIQNDEVVYADFNLMGAIHVFCFQGDPGVPGFKGEAGPKGEPVSLHMLFKMKRKHRGL